MQKRRADAIMRPDGRAVKLSENWVVAQLKIDRWSIDEPLLQNDGDCKLQKFLAESALANWLR
jgi:hypothetical protein